MDVLVMVVAAVGVALYGLPWIVAEARGHPQRNAIAALTVLAGWTVAGWVVAFVWAMTAVERRRKEERDVRREMEGPGRN